MSEQTARLALPLIAPGQAQKELFHNEGLALLDLLVQPSVVTVGATVPPDDPTAGQCWLLGPDPTGAWVGRGGAIAGWTAGGWRFVVPREGMAVWIGPEVGSARYTEGAWSVGRLHGGAVMIDGVQVVGSQASAVAVPAGGATVDSQARDAIAAILAALRDHGLIAR